MRERKQARRLTLAKETLLALGEPTNGPSLDGQDVVSQPQPYDTICYSADGCSEDPIRKC